MEAFEDSFIVNSSVTLGIIVVAESGKRLDPTKTQRGDYLHIAFSGALSSADETRNPKKRNSSN